MLDLTKRIEIRDEIKGVNGSFSFSGTITMQMVDTVNKISAKYLKGDAIKVESISINEALDFKDKISVEIVNMFLKDRYDEFYRFIEDNKEMETVIYDYIYMLIEGALAELQKTSDMGE